MGVYHWSMRHGHPVKIRGPRPVFAPLPILGTRALSRLRNIYEMSPNERVMAYAHTEHELAALTAEWQELTTLAHARDARQNRRLTELRRAIRKFSLAQRALEKLL